MPSDNEITFYDIAGIQQPWSPNTWKTRFLLNYKRLPYTTEWIDIHAIRALNEAHGKGPTIAELGLHTLPAILDGGVFIVDSAAIAAHLEERYPVRPLVTPTLLASQEAHIQAVGKYVMKNMYPIVVPAAAANFRGAAHAYYLESRPALFNQELHEMYDTADAALCVRRWAALEAGMDALAAYIDNTSHSDTSLFGMGSEPVYADFLLAGMLLWMEAAGPEDGWDKMKGWNGGMWVAAYERCRPYMQVL